jgi:eukaryotic-like serine/threonine-protein kinase
MKPEPNSSDELERLAARIADDEPVTWPAGAPGDQAVQGLREMQQLVQGFRHLQISAVAPRTPTSNRFRFGTLTVLEPLGSGAQGDVWRAYDPLLDLQVALKLRKIESGVLAHDFLDEARRLARVRQANIVSIYGAAVHEGRAGLWMELIRGTSLAQLLTQHGPFPAEEVRGIGLDLCHALATVHRHELLHGDIKTENVMREVSGRIVLMDFGAARELDSAQTSVVSGTLNYLAPEVLRGAAPSPASDIYALGVLLFRLLTGAYPYAATDLEGLLREHDSGACARLSKLRSGLPKTLVQAVECAIQVDPAKRHTSALAFAAALTASSAPAAFGWRQILAVLALAVFAVAGAVLGLSYWRGAPAWQAEAAFYRIDARGSIALNDGATVAMGDRLALQFRSSQPAYVYIFDDDGSGQTAVLFPLAGLKPDNPLAANIEHRLPGATDATALTWQISSSAAREQFIVIAADAPQPQLERRIAAWQHAGIAGTTRGALALAADTNATALDNADLRQVLAELDRNAVGHARRWRFMFPHAAP